MDRKDIKSHMQNDFLDPADSFPTKKAPHTELLLSFSPTNSFHTGRMLT